MGIKKENWPATVGIFTGVLAKEAVVGTLDALYTQMATKTNPQAAIEFDLKSALLAACATVPTNLKAVTDKIFDPLGLNIANVADVNAADKLKNGTFGAMQTSFDGQAGAFAYLLFILLYAPCVAATAAIYRETSLGWTVFVVMWTTSLAYMSATIFYQAASYAEHPLYSLMWIIGLSLAFASVLLGLWFYGLHQNSGTMKQEFSL
jgi:ferrous iron transport protein B